MISIQIHALKPASACRNDVRGSFNILIYNNQFVLYFNACMDTENTHVLFSSPFDAFLFNVRGRVDLD